MIFVISFLLTALRAHAIVMDPTFQAAESLGYQVVGEVEFNRGSTRVFTLDKNLAEIGELCPRTQSTEPGISSFAKFVVLAWGDQDYPSKDKMFHNAHEQWMAEKRAREVTEKIQSSVRGQLSFELVNMATRKAHLVENLSPGHSGRQDIKSTMELAGGAPSNALGMGLFAEYSQLAKAVIWVDCHESLVRKKGRSSTSLQLANVGQEFLVR